MKESLTQCNKQARQTSPSVSKQRTLDWYLSSTYLTGTVPKTLACLSQSTDLSVGAEWETALSDGGFAIQGIFF